MIPLILVRWQSVVDFIVLTSALYILLRWAQQARALRVALLVVGLYATAMVAQHFDLIITSWVLDGTAILAIVLLLLVFQAELRRFFMRLDSVFSWRSRSAYTVDETHQAVAGAAFRLAAGTIGALIVLVRRNSVAELISNGIDPDSKVQPALLEAIFQKTAPTHDGAVIISGDRVVRTNAVLPLTDRERVPAHYGTRHRAGMGLAERCDALVVVVSEERGEVTLMEGRRIVRVDDPGQLVQMLGKLARPEHISLGSRLHEWLLSNLQVKLAALGLSALIWITSFVSIGTTVRDVSVPVEFVNVPSGTDIANFPARLDVEVRGSPWLMDSVSLTRMVARFDLRGAHQGSIKLSVDPGNLQLPPGIVMEQVTPASFSVRLTKRGP
jgi:diadenylate cyclase